MSDKQYARSTSDAPLSRARRFGQVQSADVYSDLRFSPQYDRSFEAQVGVPVDGSNQLLRQLSPFTISVLPPLALSNVPEQSFVAGLRRSFNALALESKNLFNRFLDEIWVPQVGVTPEDQTADPGSDLTPHFKYRDFLRGKSIDKGLETQVRASIRTLAEQLEIAKKIFEDIAGGPVTITIVSGYRKGAENNKEGQAKQSQHLLGKAADIRVSGFNVENVTAVMNELMNSGTIIQGGLGFYPEDGFTHYDIRGGKDGARWTEDVVPEGFEVRTIGAAVKMLPPGPLPSERARLEEESGHSAPPQRRTVPAAPPPNIPLFDGASSVNTWQEAKDARARANLQLQGSDVSGLGSNRVLAEVFIAEGVAQTNEHGAFERPGIADQVVAVDIASQLDSILKAPPLTLLINPTSFSVQYMRVHQFSQRTRNGFLYQGWGEEQPTMSISGTIGAFSAGASSTSSGSAPSGVQFASKRDSASYQNLMALLGFYKHAGYIYDTVHKTNAHHMVGALAIEYDQWVYVGHMNSFSWGYEQDENQNGRITFEIEFKVSQMFDNHTPTSVIQPLRSPTESLSSPQNVLGSVQPEVDQVPLGGTGTPAAWGDTTETSVGGATTEPSDAPGGGAVSVPTGETGFDPNAEATDSSGDLPFCVVTPDALAVDLGCYATAEEAADVLRQYQEISEAEIEFEFE